VVYEDLQSPRYDDGYEHLGGNEERLVDDKGRIVLPAGHWRDTFAAGARLSPWQGCLALWTLRSYGSIVAELHAAQRAGDRRKGTVEAFRRQTQMVTLDGQGRLTLPQGLRERFGIGDHGAPIAIEGQGDRLEIRAVERLSGLTDDELDAELDAFDH
jgi:DNA-binding transcriptional regulator/RsmH inhibitor MraZ